MFEPMIICQLNSGQFVVFTVFRMASRWEKLPTPKMQKAYRNHVWVKQIFCWLWAVLRLENSLICVQKYRIFHSTTTGWHKKYTHFNYKVVKLIAKRSLLESFKNQKNGATKAVLFDTRFVWKHFFIEFCYFLIVNEPPFCVTCYIYM